MIRPRQSIQPTRTRRPAVSWSVVSVGGGCLAGVVAGVALVVAACGSVGDDCEFDSDCSGATLCVQQICHAACSDRRDCDSRYQRCETATRSGADGQETVKVCVGQDFESPDPDAGGCSHVGDCCRSDQECVDSIDDERAICGIDNRCIIPVVRPVDGVLIRDRTVVDSGANPPDGGPGAEIGAVYLRASTPSRQVGFATLLEYHPAGDSIAPGELFDGAAPELDAAGECIAGDRQTHTASLGGEGGYLLVQFQDAAGQPLELNAGRQVVVVEWGANCGATADDSYDVYQCSTAERGSSPSAAQSIDVATDCTQKLNTRPASGRQVLDLDSGN